MFVLAFSLTIVAAYLLGSIPTGFLVGKSRGLDIRKLGSGNIGATNVFRSLGKPAGISRVRGQRFKYRGRCLIPTFHPAAILHGGRTSVAMGQMEDDFRLIAKTLEELSVQPEADPDAEQLGLF